MPAATSHAISGFFFFDMILVVDVGKAGKHLRQGAEIGRQHKSYALHEYEILIGDPRAVRWVETRGMPNPHNFAARPVDAGVDGYGYQIFVTQVNHNGGIHPARASGGASGMFDVDFSRCMWIPTGNPQARTLFMAMGSWRSRYVRSHRKITFTDRSTRQSQEYRVLCYV